MGPQRLIDKIKKLERQRAFSVLVDALTIRPLNRTEQMRFLDRLMSLTLNQKITPKEAKVLTKLALTGPSVGRNTPSARRSA